jgi:hypothetical protein
MPFDGTPTIDWAKQGSGRDRLVPQEAVLVRTRSIPSWYVARRPEGVDAALAVLGRAREIVSDERRWCKRSYAATWLGIPVFVGSRFARRFCALGAIQHAGRKLRLPVDSAIWALEGQTVRPVADWNDDKRRTHPEVVAAFDAAIIALDDAL